jgi:hypothetical protein
VGVYELHISVQINASIRSHDEYSMCGRLPMYLSAMSFDSLSAFTVKHVSASYGNSLLYSTGSVCVNFIFSSKTK